MDAEEQKLKTGCRNLNHEEKDYPNAKLCSIAGYKYWHRTAFMAGDPINVQFCRKRGRINSIFSCYNPNERRCYEE